MLKTRAPTHTWALHRHPGPSDIALSASQPPTIQHMMSLVLASIAVYVHTSPVSPDSFIFYAALSPLAYTTLPVASY